MLHFIKCLTELPGDFREFLKKKKMAVVKMIGGQERISGRIGDIVVVVKGDKEYIRSTPKKSYHKTKSTSRMLVEEKFALANRFINVLKIWNKGEVNFRCKAIGHVVKNAIQQFGNELCVLYPKVMISWGEMSTPKVKHFQRNENGDCLLDLVPSKHSKACEMVLALYYPIRNCWNWKVVKADKATLCFEQMMNKDDVAEAYIFKKADLGSKFSDSVYLGSIF